MHDHFTTPDHIVYVVQDLDLAMEWFTARTGVDPVVGGSHPGRGTKMAIVALGKQTYLEIIGPDPLQPDPLLPRSFGMDSLSKSRLVTWAVGSDALTDRVASSRRAGYNPGEVTSWSRDRLDGVQLTWRMTMLRDPLPADGLVPFLIDWEVMAHPAKDAPGGCRLVGLRGEHPQAPSVQFALRALGVELPISLGIAPILVATLETPKGLLELS